MTAPRTEAELEELLSRPTPDVMSALGKTEGDILILGAGGKMGPTLALMARQATPRRRSVIAVSRFSDPTLRDRLEAGGVTTLAADLGDRGDLRRLPDAPNVVFMAGQKFGTRSAPHITWAMNATVPVLVAERYQGSRLVIFSTGNVYRFTSPKSGGATELDPPEPVGEYAMSCLARERIFEHTAHATGTPVAIIRLNYAIDLRYGVLLDIARRVREGTPIDCRMGYVNVIWQGDANARALQCLPLAAAPPLVLNLTGTEVLSVRWLAEEFGRRLGRPPACEGEEAADALLSNAARSRELFGPPTVPIETMLEWTVEWLRQGGATLDKPTRFEVRDGGF